MVHHINDPATGDKTKEYLHKIGASARHLLKIINEDVQKTRNAGMNDHLSKPVDPELIFKILRKY